MPKPIIPGPPPMPPMLAYTIQSTLISNWAPYVAVGYGSGTSVSFRPQTPVDDSYWILILDGMDPKKKVKDFVVPGTNNGKVPDGLDAFMTNPQYIFAVVTQYLSMLHVPQGAFYDYLVKYGAGRALQRVEQINSVLGCGSYSRVSYILYRPVWTERRREHVV